MPAYAIESLQLINYRNHSNYNCYFVPESNIIYGKNGIGKTSILEAISLIDSSKGFNSSPLKYLIKKDAKYSQISIKLNSSLGDLNITTKLILNNNNVVKQLYLNNISVKSYNDVNLDIITFTPKLDNFFNFDNSNKRKIINQLISVNDPLYKSTLKSYDVLIRERNKILYLHKTNLQNNLWLDTIEKKIAELSTIIVFKRQSYIKKLNNILIKNKKYPLNIFFEGYTESLVKKYKAATIIEQHLKEALYNNRKEDAILKSTSIGVHKSILTCINLETKQNALYSSTGEQKIYILQIIIASIYYKLRINNNIIILLDELEMHLDDENIHIIIEALNKLNIQYIITGITPIKQINNIISL